MKKSYRIMMILALIIILSSCSMERLDSGDKIIAPDNNLPPLKGKWEVEKVIDSLYKKTPSESINDFVYKEALFHKEAIVLADQYILNPKYNIRRINLSDYLLYNFKVDKEYLGVEREEVDIITVLGDNQYFYEFIKYDKDKIIVFMNDSFYFFKNTVDEISKEEVERYINIERNILRAGDGKDLESLKSGIFLGIKTEEYDEVNKIENWRYKTIWIESNNKKISSVYQMDDLLVPRKKGFWLIDVYRENINNTFEDKVNSKPSTIFEDNMQLRTMQAFGGINSPSILKNILYVGNDYISMEVINKDNNKRTLEVYPIDNINQSQGTIISDILAKEDLKSFNEVGQNILKAKPNSTFKDESFGLFRKNGSWIMKGRVNYRDENEELYEDFNIKTIPPKELVNYDDFPIPWGRIKSRFPRAQDAFISPNEDIIIIDMESNLSIYPIENKEILQEEIGTVEKNPNDTIVMAEWSTNRYTSLWRDEILKNNGKPMKYKQ